MFRSMRRIKQLLSEEENKRILQQGSSGVLAVQGDDDYPYAVPLSYVYDEDKLYFHCAGSGHKIDAIMRQPKASFCVIAQDQIVPDEYTTYFRSVIAFGQARVVTDANEKRAAIEALAKKYAPLHNAEMRTAAIDREWTPLCMFVLEIEHMTGKEAIELTRSRQNSCG